MSLTPSGQNRLEIRISKCIAEAVAANGSAVGSCLDADVTGAGIVAATSCENSKFKDENESDNVQSAENALLNWANKTDWSAASSWFSGVVNSVQKAAENVTATAAIVVKDLNIEIPNLAVMLPKSSHEDLSGHITEEVYTPPWVDIKSQHADIVSIYGDLISEDDISRVIKELYCCLSREPELFINRPDPNFSWTVNKRDQASSMLSIDKNLETLRYKMVPRVLSESEFWSLFLNRIDEFEQNEMKNLLVDKLRTIADRHQIQTSSASSEIPQTTQLAADDVEKQAEASASSEKDKLVESGDKCDEAVEFNDEEELAEYEKYLLESES